VDPAVDLPITRLSTLRELRIEGLHTDIPVGTWRLPELTSLTVEGEYTVYIVPDDIPATAKLRRLRLSCEDDDFVLDYHALPANLWGLRELFHFDCDVRLDGIPDGFSQLTGLTSLTLSPFHCVDYLMPDHFSCLSNLQCLSLRGIPDLDGDIIEPNVKVVGTLSSLQRLDISDADVRDLGFWRLTRLTALTMVRCSNGLHPSIGELDSLQTLHLADNLDFGLPDEISCLSALTNLHISDDNVLPFDLPMATFSLTRLRQLELSFLANNVQLPDELGQLQQLQYLQLSCGVLSASHSMTNLSRLTRIVLSAFDIDPVPSLSKLRQLREVSLHIRMLGTGYHTNHYLCRDLLSQANSVTSLALESYVAFLNPVETLTNLRALNLSLDNCRDWYLDDIASLSKLTSLELHWPNGPIPAAVFDVVSLRTLRIIRCGVLFVSV
jgi:Leucine-rich repeat (LRR) protein